MGATAPGGDGHQQDRDDQPGRRSSGMREDARAAPTAASRGRRDLSLVKRAGGGAAVRAGDEQPAGDGEAGGERREHGGECDGLPEHDGGARRVARMRAREVRRTRTDEHQRDMEKASADTSSVSLSRYPNYQPVGQPGAWTPVRRGAAQRVGLTRLPLVRRNAPGRASRLPSPRPGPGQRRPSGRRRARRGRGSRA